MAALFGDFLKFVLHGVLFGQTTENVFFYRTVSVAGFDNAGYDALLDEFESDIIPPINAVQSTDFAFTGIDVYNITNGVDFKLRSFTPGEHSGAIGNPSLPSYVCYTFRLQRESLVTRNGYKRFAGCTEAYVTGNTYVGPAGLMTDIEAQLAADITVGLVALVEPVILKRPLPTPVPDTHDYSSVGGCDFRGMGSQNTRKP